MGRLFGREKAGGGRREAECTRMRGLYACACGCCRRRRRRKDERKRDRQVRPWLPGPRRSCRSWLQNAYPGVVDWIAGELDDPADQERS